LTARVLVTRSQPGADETAERLRAMGCDPVVEPLFTLQPLDAPWPDFDALAFTSANGVRAFAARNARRNVPVWCVGGRTATSPR
jgi:uroporphyrinogen-III synthase